ncbi:ribonuclease ZC3H12A [Gadus chalcogrammus]|uniref:ribonuclease ZC3H12A n=1 Tax=Gadus chalcogrammus TaxID=1042646 RepID=UPI0024C4983B|nr:ribonuclease ZC3H12A [Gadus chalcogrammus]
MLLNPGQQPTTAPRYGTMSGPVQALPPDPQEGDPLRLDFFRKLGFSPMEVHATLRRLGPSTDTNSVLGELVGNKSHQQAGGSSSPSVAEADQRPAAGQRDTLGPGGRPGSRAALGGFVSTPSPPPPPPPSAEEEGEDEDELKAVVIDGSNVAMSHGNKEAFSCQGILLAVNYFLLRGHTAITVFVPSWRKEQPRPDAQITDQYILTELEKRKILVFTPSRRVGGKRVVCYDDRFIVKLAYELGAVIVSNDTYQDLQAERPEWRKCIEECLLMYSFVNDKFMPPDDPLGRHGPSLDNFLRKKPLVSEPNRPLCPYDKKCTYGLKCKFYHPERANQAYSSLADELRDKARMSTSRPERKYRPPPRGPPFTPGPAANPGSLDLETEPWPSLVPRGAAQPAKVTENFLICQEGGRTTQNHTSATWAQKDWPGRACPSHHPTNSGLSQDSGLGSYEGQFSSDGHSPWSRPAQPSVYLEGPGPRSMCGCCPPAEPSAGHYPCCSSSSISSASIPKYDTFPPHAYPPSMHQYYSLPGPPRQSRQQNHNQQQQQPKYLSMPHETRGPCSPSGPRGGPSQPGGQSCAYRDPMSHPWAPSQMGSPAFDPDRLDLRKKLQAIFNPYQVDAVMEMFPHLTDAQKLAAEILRLKAQGQVF